MRSFRFYSTRRVLNRNPLKESTVRDVVPHPGQIIHPFYSPSATEELTTCFTESYPSLLNGKRIVPAVERNSNEARLEMRSLKFRSVRGVVDWLATFKSIRDSDTDYVLLDDKLISDLVKPSKLTRNNTPMISQLHDLFGTHDSKKINSRTLTAMVEQIVGGHESGFFCEDVYLYLMQHHVNSPEKMIAIIESIKSHLKSHIDQFKVIEALILQVLVTLKKDKLRLTEPLVKSLNDLLTEVNDRFHIPYCSTQFQPLVEQEILELCIKTHNFTDSKRIFSDLIAKKYCPVEKVTVSYLRAVNEQYPKETLKEFALISDFRPIIKRAQSPIVFFYLVPLCRHLDEVRSLLTIIKSSKNVKEILDVNVTSFISKIMSLKNDPLVTSASLCSLYRMVSPFYQSKLPERLSKAFLLAFIRLEAFTMAASILKRDTIILTDDLLKSVLHNMENNRISGLSEVGAIYQKQFIDEFLIPGYYCIPLTSKLDFISRVRSSPVLSSMLTTEVCQAKNLQVDVIRKILKHGLNNKLLSQVPDKAWKIILAKPELKPVFDKYNTFSGTVGQ